MQRKKSRVRFGVLCNQIASLVWTKEVYFLGIVMALCYLWGVIYGIVIICPDLSGYKLGMVFLNAFFDLFDVGAARESVFKTIPFLVTWLVGGGALVGVMVGQYAKNARGGFRLWKRFVKDHIVVLGWDDGVLTELVKGLSGSTCDCFVVTSKNVFDVKNNLESAGVDMSHVYVYCGNYDDEKEWRGNLQIQKARQIFIMGENGEEAHDARVRILYDKVEKYLEDLSTVAKGAEIGIKVNVHDFGLAQRLEPSDGADAEHSGVYENFHLRWAKTLWREWNLPFEKEDFDLYISGFGAMGKAVAIKAIDDGMNIATIYVSDDDKKKLQEERGRFIRQFADDGEDSAHGGCIRYKTKAIEFIEEWDKALGQIKSATKNIAVVVAKKRSEKGMLCMMDVIKQLGGSANKVPLALDQEVDGYSVDSDSKSLGEVHIKGHAVQLFGMKRGCKWL